MGHRPCIVHWDQKRPGEEWSQSTWGEPLKTDMFIVSIQSIKIVREALESLVLGPYSSCLLWSSKNQCPLSKLNFRQHEKEFEPIPGYSVTRHLSVVTVLPIKCYKRSTQLIFPYISTKETLIREKSSINGWHKKAVSRLITKKDVPLQRASIWPKDHIFSAGSCVIRWNSSLQLGSSNQIGKMIFSFIVSSKLRTLTQIWKIPWTSTIKDCLVIIPNCQTQLW